MRFTKPQLLEKFRLLDEQERVSLARLSEDYWSQGIRGSAMYDALTDARIETMIEKITHLRDADIPTDEKREMASPLRSDTLQRIQGGLHRVPEGGARLNLFARLEKKVHHAYNSAVLDLEAFWNQQDQSASTPNQQITQHFHANAVVHSGSGDINIQSNIQILNQQGHEKVAEVFQEILKWAKDPGLTHAERLLLEERVFNAIATSPDDPEPGKGMALVRSLKDLLELSKLTKENWDLWIPTICEFFRLAVENNPLS